MARLEDALVIRHVPNAGSEQPPTRTQLQMYRQALPAVQSPASYG